MGHGTPGVVCGRLMARKLGFSVSQNILSDFGGLSGYLHYILSDSWQTVVRGQGKTDWKIMFFFHYFDGPCFGLFWRKKYIVLLYIVSSYEFFNYAPIKLLSGSFAGINIFLLWWMLILLYSGYNQFIILIPKRPLYLLNLILWPLAVLPVSRVVFSPAAYRLHNAKIYGRYLSAKCKNIGKSTLLA